MSLSVQYAIELATKCLPLNIEWWEEVLHPDDEDGFKHLKSALPQLKWTTGEVSLISPRCSKHVTHRCSTSTRDTDSANLSRPTPSTSSNLT